MQDKSILMAEANGGSEVCVLTLFQIKFPEFERVLDNLPCCVIISVQIKSMDTI